MDKDKNVRRRPKNLDRYLKSRYYDPRRAASYTSVRRLYRVIRDEGRFDISLKEIEDWFNKQDVHTLFRPVRRKFPRRKVISSTVNKTWDADLVDFSSSNYIKYNGGVKYILVCVDILSRQAFAKPLKSKTSREVADKLREIFDESDSSPVSLRSDSGSEFKGSVKDLLKEYNVHHHVTDNEIKAAYAESFIRYFKERIFKHMTHTKKPDYVKVIPDILHGYNSTPHTSTGEAPYDVDEVNQDRIFERLYLPASKYASLLRPVKKKKKRLKLKIGDHVRISYLRETFQKNNDQKWSGEIMVISHIDSRRSPVMYKVKDVKGEDFVGSFYSYELQKVYYDPDKPYEVDRILNTRKDPITGQTENLVRFKNWPPKFDQWLPMSSLKRAASYTS